MLLRLGALGLGLSLYTFRPRRVLCEAAVARPASAPITLDLPSSRRTVDAKGVKRFNGLLDYHQLTFGSFAGFICGYVIGKVSNVLASFLLSSLFLAEWLQYSKKVDLSPFTSRIYNVSSKYLNQGVLLEDPSFKVSFLVAFLVSAFNANNKN